MSKTCNNCQADFEWKKPYDKTKLNMDGSVHSCESVPASKATITENSISAVTALTECEAFVKKFKDLTDSKYDSTARVYNTLRLRR